MKRWRTIKRFPAYEVSASGIVRRRLPGKGTWPGRRLTPCKNGNGYLYVCLSGTRMFVHEIVCETFYGRRPSPYHQAAHRNGRKLDNRRRNIRWATLAENYADRDRHGRLPRGSNHPFAILTEAKVRRIRRLGKRLTDIEIAARMGCTHQNINLILNRRTWRHVR